MQVTSEDVATHLPRIEHFARMFNGQGRAEYDDLVQEGSEKVFLLLRDEQSVSNTAIKNAMRDWVRYCRRKGFAESHDEASLDYSTGVHSAPGRRRTFWADDEDAVKGGWTPLGYVPETA